ncbi:MAG: addiction module protein [Aequorivita sp.]
METKELREKLKIQFSEIIEDDRNLNFLEKIFETMNDSEYVSQVPESHYKIVDERRRKSMAGETKGLTWEEVKLDIKGKK